MKKIAFVLFSILVILTFSACSSIPEPQITKAEFPFEIVYEIDGELITVTDTYVCEFEGVYRNAAVGEYLEWKGYVKSTGNNYLVLLEDGNLQLVCSLGSAAYYMGDPAMEGTQKYTPSIYYVKTLASGNVVSGMLGIEPILEQYKIKLVSWKLSEPLENTFR